MFLTILGLLAALAIVSFAVWLILNAAYRFLRRRTQTLRENVSRGAPWRRSRARNRTDADAIPVDDYVAVPVPPGVTLLETERVPIAQLSNPTPMFRTRGTEGTARWYRAPSSYADVASWYAVQLANDGWEEEEGHGTMRVFRRDGRMLWVADATNPDVWRRLTQPSADPPRRTTTRESVGNATFTVLTYRTDGGGAPSAFGRGPFGGFGRFGGGPRI